MDSKFSCVIARRGRQPYCIGLRTVNPANYAFLFYGPRHAAVYRPFSTRRGIDFRIDGNVVISMCGADRYTAGAPCVERCSRSIDRCIGVSAIRRDLAAGDRVAIVRSAIAHNTNRTFRGRTGGDRLRTHHVENPWEVLRSWTGTPVLRCRKRCFPRVRSSFRCHQKSSCTKPVVTWFALSRIGRSASH